ncbi:Membrane-spanning 4-domains subfamily A member 7 [Camelus dromedarius]|uniref:Membrane-spanning 4-domains subfamily A member 7 n=1 Tax=Camelus dromedarius TaxID=9838 RepID=A0A5N4DNP4_CAMDR|nr:Membrane-spanning 4-domains subfamily A member 7 [Camelus dromedarius]
MGIMSQPKTKGAFDAFTSKGIIIPEGEKPGHIYQKEDNPQDSLQKEATVLGIIQILCCLMISSLGAILASAPYSSHFNPAISTIVMSGYPFLGALCVMSSLTSNAMSSLAAGAGLLLLANSLGALSIVSQLCDSKQDYPSSLPYSAYYYAIYEDKDCRLTGVSLTGGLMVMLIFTVLELLLATYASVFWWKQVCSNNLGGAFFLPQSQDRIQHVKKSSKSWI